MKGFFCTAGLLLTAALAGCGSAELFRAHPLDEPSRAAELAWPRLVDTPQAPAPGEYTAAVPDPAQGTAVEVQLRLAARDAEARARAQAAEPVLTEDERRRLLGRR
jgi:hypothetical protein